MDIINLVDICTCDNLNEDNKPLKRIINFNNLNKNIVVWGEIINVYENDEIDIEWYTPNNTRVFTLTIPIKKTTSERISRYFWGVMKFKLVYLLNENIYGIWKINIPKLKTSYEFNIRALTINYRNNILQNENAIILDFKI